MGENTKEGEPQNSQPAYFTREKAFKFLRNVKLPQSAKVERTVGAT
jgi:hypothetical protein